MHDDIPDWIVAPIVFIVVFAISGMIVFIGASIVIYAPWLFLVIPIVWAIFAIRWVVKNKI